jgi:pyridine nucleotide-disulfide oxidoreductase family protein
MAGEQMKRMVLLGAGHAHLAVLKALADRPLPGWDVRLVTPHRRQLYSGMLPGWIAGQHPLDAGVIALDAWADRAAIAFHPTLGVDLVPGRRALHCADGATLHYDLLSIDTGAAPPALPGAAGHALSVRPIENFVAAWPALVERILARCRRFDLVVVGGGAAGVELALAIRHRSFTDGWSHLRLTLVGAGELPLRGAPVRLRRGAAALLTQRGVQWQGGRCAVRIDAGQVAFDHGDPLAFDACLVATGAAAPAWPRASGLATDERGFIRVGATLQSVSHSQVLAAGDIAALHHERPKSGVFAVRAGPVLAHNLRALCEGGRLRRWNPQRHALALIATGGRDALVAWGPFSASGTWAGHWKKAIDQAFVRRYAMPGQRVASPADAPGTQEDE